MARGRKGEGDVFRWLKELFASRSQPCADGVMAARPESAAKVEKLKADFEAATRIWPRDPGAITRTYERLRDARHEQLRAELGR